MENYKDREIKALKSKLNDFQSYVKDIRNGIGSVVNESDSKRVGAILLELLNTKTQSCKFFLFFFEKRLVLQK